MKYSKLSLFVIIIIQSCSYFANKDKLLTKDKWVLYSLSKKDIHSNMVEYDLYFKKSDDSISLSFHEDGTVKIEHNKGESYTTTSWAWNEDGKYIVLGEGSYLSGKYQAHIKDGRFSLSKWDEGGYKKLTLYSFHHLDNESWTDKIIDLARSQSAAERIQNQPAN